MNFPGLTYNSGRSAIISKSTIIAMALAIMTTIAGFHGTGAQHAHAQGRIDARDLTCEDVKELLFRRGSAVLTTGRFTYEKYVKSRTYCRMDEVTTYENIETVDTPRCRVRKCVPFSRYGRD